MIDRMGGPPPHLVDDQAHHPAGRDDALPRRLSDDLVEQILTFATLKVRGEDGSLLPWHGPSPTDISAPHLGIYAYDGSFHDEGTWKEVMELEDLESLMRLLARQPLQHQPGERYTYGMSTAVLGYLVERLSGQTLENFLTRELFEPLGMVDTQFGLSEEDRQRFQPLSVWEQDHFREGTLVEDELYYRSGSALQLGGEGLVSTLEDYGRFCGMLANGGRTLQGRALIQPETLQQMTQDQLGEIPGFDGAVKGRVLGFGFEILQDRFK